MDCVGDALGGSGSSMCGGALLGSPLAGDGGLAAAPSTDGV